MKVSGIKKVLTGYKMPNLSMPGGNKATDKVTKLFNGNKLNTSGILDKAKSRVPSNLQRYIPNLGTGNGAGGVDVSKIMSGASFDVEGLLSKKSDFNSLLSSFSGEINIDSSLLPSTAFGNTINLSSL